MKKLNVKITNALTATEETTQVKSECAMWSLLRKTRNTLSEDAVKAGVRAVVTDEEGKAFKDITFRLNKKGKIEMPNAVKETNRIRTKKAVEAQEAPTKDTAAAA